MKTQSPVLDMEMAPRQQTALAESAQESSVSMFERMARDPSVDVDKLDRLMQMHERVTARLAQEQFNAAMSHAQTEMRPIAADAENPQTRSKYASYAALDRPIRPIYTRHGFGLSFDTGETPIPEYVRVLCHVTHAAGAMRTYHVDMPADGKGARGGDVMTKTHATGAALSYGMRYLLKMIFNIAVGEADDDGNYNTERQPPPSPNGYDDWLSDMEALAESGDGLSALQAAWTKSKPEYRKHLTATNQAQWNAIKVKAAKAAKSGDVQ